MTNTQIFEALKKNASAVAKTTYSQRKELLKKLHNALMDNRLAMQKAVYDDMQKPAEECDLTELLPVLSSIRYAMPKLKTWTQPQSVATPLPMLGTSSAIIHEPKGTVLIVSPWNYPFNLSFDPLVSAIAAGNTVIIKPSELTPNCSELMQKIVNSVFEPNHVAVIQGDASTATELIAMPFDHIFFTGSPHIGKIVMQAAAQNLCSVTLELGGKSPTIVDETANITHAAQRIVWGKYSNCGQTCIAPDYILVHHTQHQPLIDAMKIAINDFYGTTDDDQINSKSYGRIVNQRHFNRLLDLLQNAVNNGANIAAGGTYIAEQNYMSPTILQNINVDDALTTDEIFGPILPIIPYKTTTEAIDIINKKPKPLALYIFSNDAENTENIIKNTSAGGTCVNNTLIHFFNHNLPFGGVNNSGIGKTHGFFGFQAFSNARGVVRQKLSISPTQFTYPPYTQRKQDIIDLGVKYL